LEILLKLLLEVRKSTLLQVILTLLLLLKIASRQKAAGFAVDIVGATSMDFTFTDIGANFVAGADTHAGNKQRLDVLVNTELESDAGAVTVEAP